jgi:hypothetical protein
MTHAKELMMKFSRSVRTRGAGLVHDERNDEGSVLILALIYLVATGVAMFALTGWLANDLGNVTHFSAARELQQGASSTAELAIQNMRYTPLLATTTVGTSYCWGSGPNSEVANLDGNSFEAWCSTNWDPTSADTRVVTISVCLATLTESSCVNTPSSPPYLQAVVTFDDYPPGGAAPVQGPCTDWGWCGEGMTVDSWDWA